MLSLPRYLSDVVGQYHEYPMSVTPRSKNPPPFSHPPPLLPIKTTSAKQATFSTHIMYVGQKQGNGDARRYLESEKDVSATGVRSNPTENVKPGL